MCVVAAITRLPERLLEIEADARLLGLKIEGDKIKSTSLNARQEIEAGNS